MSKLSTARFAFGDRVFLSCALIGNAYSGGLLLAGWGAYNRPGLVLAAWLLSLAAPICAWLSGPRDGRLPAYLAFTVVGVVLAVDLASTLGLAQPDRLGYAFWAPGAGALTTLGLAAFRPHLEILGYVLAHGGAIAAATIDVATPSLVLGASAALVPVSAAVIPPLVGAVSVRTYGRVRVARDALVRAKIESEVRIEAIVAERRGLDEWLTLLRDDLRPLLVHAMKESTLPSTDLMERARMSVSELRTTLAAGHSGSWLQSITGQSPGVRFQVTDPGLLIDRMDERDRAALVAVLRWATNRIEEGVLTCVIDGGPEGVRSVVTATGVGVDASLPAEVESSLPLGGFSVAWHPPYFVAELLCDMTPKVATRS